MRRQTAARQLAHTQASARSWSGPAPTRGGPPSAGATCATEGPYFSELLMFFDKVRLWMAGRTRFHGCVLGLSIDSTGVTACPCPCPCVTINGLQPRWTEN